MILSQVFPKLDKEYKKMDAPGKKKFASQIMKAVKGHRKLGQKGFLLWTKKTDLAKIPMRILDQVKFGEKQTSVKLEEIIPWKAYKGLSDSKFVEKQYVKDKIR